MALDAKQSCALCGKPSETAGRLIVGLFGAVCRDCVELSADLLEAQTDDARVRPRLLPTPLPPLRPREIVEFLDEHVIGQTAAKRAVAVAVYSHSRRVTDSGDSPRLAKSNVLLVGPTGTGKTLIAQSLAKLLRVPFAMADATSLTEAGYVGEDVEGMLRRLLQSAEAMFPGEDPRPHAERGIVFLDEVDKLARRGDSASLSRDVGGEGVQQALLKLFEGTVAQVPIQGARRHPEAETTTFDTRNVLFIASGAFVGLDEIVRRRCVGGGLGLRQAVFDPAQGGLRPEDLVAYGFLPEFVGRLPVLTRTEELTEPLLIRVLTEPKDALVAQYAKLLDFDGVRLEFAPGALGEIAREAIRRGTGARALRSILEEVLHDALFEAPSSYGITRVLVPDGVLTDGRPPLLLRDMDLDLRLTG